MTFVLKDFNELTGKFRATVRVILEREKKKEIIDLADPRKTELQFLFAVINELEKRIAEHKIHNTKPYALILYGAMKMISEDINNHLGMLQKKDDSQLYSSLMESMFLNEATQKLEEPDHNQVQAMYDALHKFLQLIYVDQNSRKGINEEHAFNAIPTKKLKALIELSYSLDQAANDRALAVLKPTGKTTADIGTYRVETATPMDIVKQFKTWKDLQQQLIALIEKERADKNVSNVSKLKSANRAAQLNFLLAIENSLEHAGISNPEKVAILAGAMYIVRGQINEEYSRNALDLNDIPSSIIHSGLSEILNAKAESLEDIEAMISATSRYLKFCTVEHASEEVKTDSFRAAHILSNTTWNLMTGFNLINRMINTCRLGALDICLSPSKESAAAAAKAPDTGAGRAGFFGKLLGPKPAADSTSAAAAAAVTTTTTPGLNGQ